MLGEEERGSETSVLGEKEFTGIGWRYKVLRRIYGEVGTSKELGEVRLH